MDSEKVTEVKAYSVLVTCQQDVAPLRVHRIVEVVAILVLVLVLDLVLAAPHLELTARAVSTRSRCRSGVG